MSYNCAQWCHAMGPLAGIKVIEMAGAGPVPMCAMLLSDLGATILRIERKSQVELGVARPLKFDLMLRGRKSIALDLKQAGAAELVLQLVESADVLLEGYRPGAMERLGLGPDVCLARRPRLIYARLTGWGQTGPLAKVAGHDINYIALTGALHAIGRRDQAPTPPINLLGDFAGGALYAALGVLSALLEAQRSGIGQTIDSAVVDGTIALMTHVYGGYAAGLVDLDRGSNFSDSGAFFYDVYECADGNWISIGPLESRFYSELLRLIDIDPATLPAQKDREKWAVGRARLATQFRTKSRDEWSRLLEYSDVCFAPVLSLAEAPLHPHNQARNNFHVVDGILQPAPAPKFSRTSLPVPTPPEEPCSGDQLTAVLGDWLSASDLERARERGVLQ